MIVDKDVKQLAKLLGREIIEDEEGRVRFKENKLIRRLVDTQINLNKLWDEFCDDQFSLLELIAFYMDMGYTVCGFLEIFSKDAKLLVGDKLPEDSDWIDLALYELTKEGFEWAEGR